MNPHVQLPELDKRRATAGTSGGKDGKGEHRRCHTTKNEHLATADHGLLLKDSIAI
jgi:hypothetical protein